MFRIWNSHKENKQVPTNPKRCWPAHQDLREMSSVPPQVSFNYPPTHCWQGPKETLWSVVHAWECVCVRVHTCIPQNTVADSPKLAPAPPASRQYSRMHTHCKHSCIHQSLPCHVHALVLKKKKKKAHRCVHRRHTQGFSFPHSCVLISNRTRWGRTNTLTRKD